MDHALVLGATGSAGRWLVRILRARGVEVSAASRDAGRLRMTYDRGDVRLVTVDPTHLDDVTRASARADTIFNCTGHGGDVSALSAIARTLAALVDTARVRVVHLSSAWSFTPLTGTTITEEHPRVGCVDVLAHRRRSEDVLAAAGATVVHLPDFFGPGVDVSPLQFALRHAVDGQPFLWISDADVAREHAYLPDAMAVVADLASVPASVGERVIVPGCGPISIREVASIVGSATGRTLAFVIPGEVAPGPEVDASFVAALGPMAGEYRKPVAYDGRKLLTLLPGAGPTPYSVSIPATLASLLEQARV